MSFFRIRKSLAFGVEVAFAFSIDYFNNAALTSIW
jgi:hypothetical protein